MQVHTRGSPGASRVTGVASVKLGGKNACCNIALVASHQQYFLQYDSTLHLPLAVCPRPIS
jgi:hypothetical protein